MGAEPQEIETSTEPFIFGLEAMGTELHRCRQTIARWVRVEDFPAAKLPNGDYVTSHRLIDMWLLSRCQAREKRSNGAREVLGV